MKPFIFEFPLNAMAEAIYALFAHEKNSVYLDSALDIQGMGRYSFIARDPFLVFASKHQQVLLTEKDQTSILTGNPFAELKRLLNVYHTEKIPNMPPLAGGIIGYFGYDLGYIIEPRVAGHSRDDLAIPDCQLGFYDTVIIIDHHDEKLYIASTGFPALQDEARQVRAKCRADELAKMITAATALPEAVRPVPAGELHADFSYGSYCAMVNQALAYIAAGDIFQVNLSQRFKARINTEPFQLYRYLRKINPAPFAAYLNLGDFIVASASPERYLHVDGQYVETRPIKGTRPRGHDPESDERYRHELYHSEKDKAELVMIIDLERNDLGKVCEYGSVKVPELIRLEEYATVFHLVSTVTGKIAPEHDIIDLVVASFPGGSITGAPKVRAMEIVDELEPVRRGIYTGSIGYINFNGDADLNIAIRTMVIKQNQAFFQVGGGIVADSQAELEYAETFTKAKALIQALGYQR